MSNVYYFYLWITIYLALNAIAIWLSTRRKIDSVESYYLANRNIGPVALVFTIAATNFSAFFFLGFSGAAYTYGYSYYGIISVGTALAGVTIYISGDKAWRLCHIHKFITPNELIGTIHRNKYLEYIYITVYIVFTLPYLALQPIGAGYLIENLTNGEVSYFWGAILSTSFIVLYVYIGGMKSVVYTDVLQGILMGFLMVMLVITISDTLGGLHHANLRINSVNPELFHWQGVKNAYSFKLWISYTLLWSLCIPMFPHIFARFFIFRDQNTIRHTAYMYPIITGILFLLPVIIGVIGHISFPDLTGKGTDTILPKMLSQHLPVWLASLFMTGAIAAFMSTMDSQLLSISTIVTRDIVVRGFGIKLNMGRQVLYGRVAVLVISVIALIIAYQPPATILKIAINSFTGIAILFPATLYTLYSKNPSTYACILSVVSGELLLLAHSFDILGKSFTFGFLPIVPIVFISSSIIVVSIFTKYYLDKRIKNSMVAQQSIN